MLRGTLDEFSLPDVLRLLSLARKTGVLNIARRQGKGRFFFRDGDVYYAESSTDTPSVAQRLVDSGSVSDQDVDDALAESEASGTPVGDILIASGKVSVERLQGAVLQQIHDASFDLMRWGEGEFSWQQVTGARPEVPVALSVDDLIIEAARRLDEMAVRERRVVDEGSVLALSPAFASAADPITITPQQWRVLALLDGRRSAVEVAAEAGMDVDEVLRDLYHLVSIGVVEAMAEPRPERVTPAATERPPAPVVPDAPAAPSVPKQGATSHVSGPPVPPRVPQEVAPESPVTLVPDLSPEPAVAASPSPDPLRVEREKVPPPLPPLEPTASEPIPSQPPVPEVPAAEEFRAGEPPARKPAARKPRKAPPTPPRRPVAKPAASPGETTSQVEPSTAPGEEDFALFQQIAIASAKQVTDEPVEAFDAPGPDEMTTRVPPPPPPGSNTTAGEQVDIADDMGAADEEVDPALIARLIQGVKDL